MLDALTLNLYTYCGNNPVMYYDLSRHNMCDCEWQPVNQLESVKSTKIKQNLYLI